MSIANPSLVAKIDAIEATQKQLLPDSCFQRPIDRDRKERRLRISVILIQFFAKWNHVALRVAEYDVANDGKGRYMPLLTHDIGRVIRIPNFHDSNGIKSVALNAKMVANLGVN